MRQQLWPHPEEGRLGSEVVVLVAADERFGRSGGTTGEWNLELRSLDGNAPLIIRKAFVPAYVAHLLATGTQLPVAVHGKRLAVDWPEAAARDAAGGGRAARPALAA